MKIISSLYLKTVWAGPQKVLLLLKEPHFTNYDEIKHALTAFCKISHFICSLVIMLLLNGTISWHILPPLLHFFWHPQIWGLPPSGFHIAVIKATLKQAGCPLQGNLYILDVYEHIFLKTPIWNIYNFFWRSGSR